MFETILNNEFLWLNDPINAEEYANKSPSEKFMYSLKWAKEEFLYGKKAKAKDKLKMYDKPLEKEIFRLYFKNNTHKDFENKYEIQQYLNIELNIELNIISYLFRIKDKKIKKPKYNIYYQYKIIPIKLKLKGNEYIEY